MERYQEEAHERAMEELIGPLAEALFSEIFDDEKALNALLPEVMVQGTEHHPDEYRSIMMNHFNIPAIQGHAHEHWKKGISEQLAARR